MSVRSVIDTNVIVSRFLSPGGTPARIVSLWEQGVFSVVISEAILEGYHRVLAYPRIQSRHGMLPEEIEEVIAGFRSFAEMVEPSESLTVVADDPSDNRFLEAALAGQCAYIVSGDPHLLRIGEFRGIQLVMPAAFLRIIEPAPG